MVQLDARALRGSIELHTGVPGDALAILLQAGREAVGVDPHRAVRILLTAREAAYHAMHTGAVAEIARLVRDLPDDGEPEERDFRHLKADDLDLRPIYRRLEDRVRAHVLICMLALYLTWHLRNAWAPLTYTDDEPPAHADPVAPATRSAAAQAKASRQHAAAGQPVRSYQGLLAHLATLPRNQIRIGGAAQPITMLTEPTPIQRQAFELIGAPIPSR